MIAGRYHAYQHCCYYCYCTVPQGAARGDRVLKVWDTSSISVGQWVRIMQKDPGDGSLMFELNGNAMAITDAQKGYPDPCRFLTRVQAKGSDWIRTERVVPFKVNLGAMSTCSHV